MKAETFLDKVMWSAVLLLLVFFIYFEIFHARLFSSWIGNGLEYPEYLYLFGFFLAQLTVIWVAASITVARLTFALKDRHSPKTIRVFIILGPLGLLSISLITLFDPRT